VTSEWIEKFNVGRAIPPQDVPATATALNEMLDLPKNIWNEGFDRIESQFTWEKVVQPLVDFCYHGSAAPDRASLRAQEELHNAEEGIYQKISNPVKKAAFLWATRGSGAMIRQIKIHVRFLLTRHRR
jgi:hypothetical protein